MNQRRWTFVLYYICAAAVISYLFRGDLPTSYRFVRHGIETQAVVTETSCKSSTPIRYTFTVNGIGYQGYGPARFGNPPCEGLKAGDPVIVSYLPSHPVSNMPGNPDEKFWTEVVGVAMAALFIPLVGLFAIFLVLRRSKKRSALS